MTTTHKFPFLGQVQVHLVAVKVGVVGRAHTLVEAEGAAFQDFCSVGHNRDPVQAGLPVEKDNIPIYHVPIDKVSWSQLLGNVAAVAVLQILSHTSSRACLYKVGPRVGIWTILDHLSHLLQVVRRDMFRVGQDLGKVPWNSNL